MRFTGILPVLLWYVFGFCSIFTGAPASAQVSSGSGVSAGYIPPFAIVSPTSGQCMTYNGTAWVNASCGSSSTVPASGVQAGTLGSGVLLSTLSQLPSQAPGTIVGTTCTTGTCSPSAISLGTGLSITGSTINASGGGSLPSTTNIITGNGSGGGANSGVALDYVAADYSIYLGITPPTSPVGQGNYTFGYGAGSAMAASGITQPQADVAIGYNALTACTACREIVAIGYNALASLTTTGNGAEDGTTVAIGSYAGQSVVSTGSGASVAIGQKAAASATVLASSTIIGSHAGESSTSSTGDTFVGAGTVNGTSLGATTNDNVFVGAYISANTPTGTLQYNVAVGSHAGPALTGGAAYDVFAGYYAGGGCTSCTDDILIGYNAGLDITTASHNIAIGENSLQNATSAYNVAIGYYAAQNLTSGTATAVGDSACSGITTGTYNSCFGHNAGGNGGTGSGGVFVGDSAGFSDKASNDTVIGVSAMGANTSPTGGNNTAIGNSAAYSMTSGGNNVAVGYAAGAANTTGSQNIAIGWQAGNTYPTTGGTNILIGYNINTVAGGTGNEINVGNALIGYATNPTLTSGWGTSPTAPTEASTFSFHAVVGATGTPSSATVIGLSTAPHSWNCSAQDLTTNLLGRMTAESTTSVTITWYSLVTGTATAPSNSDSIWFQCKAN